MPQKKKLETDPDWDQLNPEIIRLAHGNGFINQPIQLYLHGDLTWLECLETIVLLVTKEYRAQNRLLIDTLSERPNATLLLNGANGELVKCLPPRPLQRESTCKRCGRILTPDTDCGGDCVWCMAEAGDPECIEAVHSLTKDA